MQSLHPPTSTMRGFRPWPQNVVLMGLRGVACLGLLILVLPSVSSAQEWLGNIPNRNTRALTFSDFKNAFEAFYKAHPIEILQEAAPPGVEATAQEEESAEAEEYNQFKRWEWFTEPRVFPTGRWNNQKIIAEFEKVASIDTKLKSFELKFGSKLNIAEVLPAPPPPVNAWEPLGPTDALGGTNMGRVNAIAIDPNKPGTIYIGSPAGGVWKTVDAGASWSTSTDALPTLSIGDIVIDPQNTNNVYAASGDAFGYGNPFWGGTYGIGIWKSTDGGSTWSATGLSFLVGQNRTIRKLAISPRDSKLLLAATSAGLFKTADAGIHWAQVWADSTFDVEFNPSDGAILYATTNQVKKSVDAGAHWSSLQPSCAGQRFSIQVAKSHPDVLYTLCTDGVVQKSVNAGSSWTTASASGVKLYGYYDNVLAVSPIDENVVIVAGFNIKKSSDGGNSWSSLPTAGHVNNHCIRFSGSSSTTIYSGNDGGIFLTTNGGSSWSSINKGLAITQFYRVGLSASTPRLLIAGAQDNGNMKLDNSWTNITGGDGVGGFIDFANDNNIYAAVENGTLYRSANGGATWVGINTPSTGAWVTPLVQSKTSATTIFAGTDKVYKSTNQGSSWTAISSALSGAGPLTILRVHKDPKILLAGNGHKLYRTTNAGSTWSDITGALPVTTNYLTDARMNDNDSQMIWVTFSGYNAGQKVYKSTNGGSSWINISGSLPNLPVNCVEYEDRAMNPIYVGTDAGVYYIRDGLPDFVPYKTGLPNVIIDDLKIQGTGKKIIAATYGRGIWTSDLKP